jgi:CBS domain-containing protein
MFDAAARLASLHVHDVMNPSVVTVPAGGSMAAAAGLMLQHGISGAPVMHGPKECVGILSASDFVRKVWVDSGQESPELTDRLQRFQEMQWGQELFASRDPDKNLVGFHMTPAVQGIPLTSTLQQAAEMMCALHVHRLPVLTPRGELAGMITALDIVAALVNALQEDKQTRGGKR